MFTIKHYSKYLHNGVDVVSKDRLFPLTPVFNKTKKYKQFFMVSDDGVASFVSLKDILNKFNNNSISTSPISKSPGSKGRGKKVLHRSSGQTFGSMKAACDALNIKVSQLKSSPDFVFV